jgi:hypothetical protein
VTPGEAAGVRVIDHTQVWPLLATISSPNSQQWHRSPPHLFHALDVSWRPADVPAGLGIACCTYFEPRPLTRVGMVAGASTGTKYHFGVCDDAGDFLRGERRDAANSMYDLSLEG